MRKMRKATQKVLHKLVSFAETNKTLELALILLVLWSTSTPEVLFYHYIVFIVIVTPDNCVTHWEQLIDWNSAPSDFCFLVSRVRFVFYRSIKTAACLSSMLGIFNNHHTYCMLKWASVELLLLPGSQTVEVSCPAGSLCRRPLCPEGGAVCGLPRCRPQLSRPLLLQPTRHAANVTPPHKARGGNFITRNQNSAVLPVKWTVYWDWLNHFLII